MKRVFLSAICLLLCAFLFAGCGGAPKLESVAPCLPGIVWGMTEGEVCSVLEWNKADLETYGERTAGTTAARYSYGKSGTQAWGIPCDLTFGESTDSGITSVHMLFDKADRDAVFSLLEQQGFALKEDTSPEEGWTQQGEYLFQFCSEEEQEEILQYRMRYWKEISDMDEILKTSAYQTEEELAAAAEKSIKAQISDGVLYRIDVRPDTGGKNDYMLEINGAYSAILNRIRSEKAENKTL